MEFLIDEFNHRMTLELKFRLLFKADVLQNCCSPIRIYARSVYRGLRWKVYHVTWKQFKHNKQPRMSMAILWITLWM